MDERFCKLCFTLNEDQFGDEYHVLLVCPFYEDFRYTFISSTICICVYTCICVFSFILFIFSLFLLLCVCVCVCVCVFLLYVFKMLYCMNLANTEF